MRINAKSGKEATIKLDKRELDILRNAFALCGTIHQHGRTLGPGSYAEEARSVLGLLIREFDPTFEKVTEAVEA